MKNNKLNAFKSADGTRAINLLKTLKGRGVKPLKTLILSLILMSNLVLGFTTTWTGGNGIIWNDAGSWNNGVPGSGDDVIINDPIVSGNYLEISGTEQCRNITFINDGYLSFGSTGTNKLEIYGDLINNSNSSNIVTSENGSMVMRGTNDNEIDGSTPIYLFHLQIKKSIPTKIVDVNVGLEIGITLDSEIGELQSNNNLTMLGDINYPSTACVVANLSGNGTITGLVTVQQIVPEYAQVYHYLGSPVGETGENTAYTIENQFLDNTTADNVYNWSNQLINTTFPDWLVYDETVCLGQTASWVEDYYYNAINVDVTLAQATWMLTTFGWESNDNLLSQNIPAGTGVLSRVEFDITAKVLDWHGTLNNGTIYKTLDKSTCDFGDGFNLACNPYPGPIDWEELYADNYTEVDPFAYIWTADENAVSPFGAGFASGFFTVLDATNSTSTIGNPDWCDESGSTDNIIGIGQGFMVRALDDNATLTFNNTARTVGIEPWILRESKAKEALQLLLEGINGKDYTNIYLNPAYEDTYNFKEDALKMMNPGLNLASRSDDKDLMINRLNSEADEIVVPLMVSINVAGTTKFSIGNGAFESNEYVAIFIDKKLNKQQLIAPNFEYSYVAKAGDDNDRFIIKFVKGNSTMKSTSNNNTNMYLANHQLHIFAEHMAQASINITDASGRIVQQQNVIFNNNKALLNMNDLSNGIYIVNVAGTQSNFNQKIYINK